jgi:hypothetical protein
LLAQTARVWWMRTKHPLAAVLADGYWDTMKDVRLLKEDTIQLVSAYGADRAEHSILIVTVSLPSFAPKETAPAIAEAVREGFLLCLGLRIKGTHQ